MAANRSKEEKELFGRAAEEVAETGQLSFPTRRRLWLALGEWEQRGEDGMEEHLQADGLHPDGDGQRIIAGRVWSLLMKERL